MMNKCHGCGVPLQTNDKDAVGYTPKVDSKYCQRCFRLRHYGDLISSFSYTSDNQKILDTISKMDALFFWVVDLFDFESSFVTNINRYLKNKDIIMILTKRDLLPDTLSQRKLQQFIQSRLQFYDVSIKGYIVSGAYGNDGKEEIIDAMQKFRNNKDIVFFGLANSGKSTVLNAIFGNRDITTSPYPGTTLEINQLSYMNYQIYDTPGFNNEHSVLWNIDTKHIKEILPNKRVYPRIYQLKQQQSFAIGGIARVDVSVKSSATVVFYMADTLSIHRGKLERADSLWAEHQGKLLYPSLNESELKKIDLPKKGDNFDIVIQGLGWISLKGDFSVVSIWVHPQILVLTREAMV